MVKGAQEALEDESKAQPIVDTKELRNSMRLQRVSECITIPVHSGNWVRQPPPRYYNHLDKAPYITRLFKAPT